MLFFGAIFGAVIGGVLHHKIGRKMVMEAIGCPMLVVGFSLVGTGKWLILVMIGRQVTAFSSSLHFA